MTSAGIQVEVLDEPLIEFGEGQRCVDPHDGLALFGPYAGVDSPSYVLIATVQGADAWSGWARTMNEPITTQEKDTRLWPTFPGYDVAFGTRWRTEPTRAYELDREDLLSAARLNDSHERCFSVVEQVLAPFDAASKLEPKPNLAICVVPDEVWSNCRPESQVANPIGKKLSAKDKKLRSQGHLEFFEEFNSEQYRLAPDFRRQLKARSMEYEIPIQIIRESTLRLSDDSPLGSRGLTPLSDRLWNISTTSHYKAGGKPWKLAGAREGVCYIGLAFRQVPDEKSTACCAAQMFLDSGDGIVFLGEYGPWYSVDKNQFHLTKDAATKLLQGALDTYQSIKTPADPAIREIFLHSRSWINDDEFQGYLAACPENCKLVGVRVRPDRFGPRLFRDGDMPVMRGTLWTLGENSAYLFGSGFKPRLGSYDGWEVPAPLKIDIQHGTANINTVAKDIFALTKLNYNTCKLGDSQPVTVRFSDAVGEILISNPTVKIRKPNFKYYI